MKHENHDADRGEQTAGAGRGTEPRSRLLRVRDAMRSLGPILGLAAAWALFAALVGERFMSWENQRLMLLQSAVIGTAAVGATLVIIARGLDLSVGSTIALGTVVVALTLKAGLPPWLAALSGVSCGLACGCAIGALVTGSVGAVGSLAIAGGLAWWVFGKFGLGWALATVAVVASVGVIASRRLLGKLELSPFVVTLGMWGALRGLAKGLGDNQPVYPPSSGWLASLMSTAGKSGWYLPPGVWVLLVAALLMTLILRSTVFGRRAYAIGSNEVAARMAGVPIDAVKLGIYTVAVGFAGVASLLQFSYLSMGDPTTADGYELRVIAAVVIGGASLSGGEGTVRGTIVGTLLMTVVDNGCTRLGIDNWIQEVITGGIIVAAVAIDRMRQERGA